MSRRSSKQQDGADIRIEYPSRGATYNRPVYGVYEYSTYPRSSVLAGQQRRIFLESFETLDEARAIYPDADVSSCGYQAPSLNHLPDDGDDDSYSLPPSDDWRED